MPSPKHSIVFWTPPHGSETDIEVGKVVLPDSSDSSLWVVATTANRGSRRSEGVAISEHGGSGFGTFELAQVGTIDRTISGLAVVNTGRSLVRCSSTGTIERIATVDVDPDTDDIIGYAEEDGRVHLYIGFPFSELLTIINSSGADGKTVKAMADADQALTGVEQGKALLETTGALTAARTVTYSDVGAEGSSIRRTVQHSGTDAVLLVGTTTGTQQVALRPGHRASVEFTPDGAYAIHEKPLDPRDFDCKWDGVTDDAPAFQAMLDSLPASKMFPVHIKLPAGRAWFSTDVEIARPVIITGEGNTIHNLANETIYTPHYSLYGTVIRSAPGKAGFVVRTAVDSSDGGSGRGARFSGFSMHGSKVIPSTGSHGRNVMSIDPTYDTRQDSTAYSKGRVVLASGASTTGSGTYDEGATRGGTRVCFRCTTGGTTASSAPAAIASATTSNIGDTITDGTVVWTVESVPKDYEHSRAYVVGEKCLCPGNNAVVLECIVPGTSLASGANSQSDYGIGTNVPGNAAQAIHDLEFLDDAGNPSGLKWRAYCPAGIVVMAPEVIIDDLHINGYMGAAVLVSSDVGVGGVSTSTDANFWRIRDVESYYCGMGLFIRGSDANGGKARECNFRFTGHSRSNVDSSTYLNLGYDKWGNGGYAVLDRALGGGIHDGHYSQFANAPAWCNHKLESGGFNAKFRDCLGETTFNSIVRGLGSYIDCTPILYSSAGGIESTGFVLDSQGNYGRGIREVDMAGYGTKRMKAGIMAGWGTGGAFYFTSLIDEWSGNTGFGWGYQTTCIDAGTSGTGWYTLGYGQYYARTAFSLAGAKAAEGLGHIRFDRGFFLGNETDGARYIGPLTEQTSVYVRHGRRLVGDLFVDHSATSGYSEQRVTVAGYEGVSWASVSGVAAVVCESGTTSYYIASVALKGDQIKLSDGRVVRVTAKTGDGLHPVAEPALASLVTPGDTEVVNTGTATITYYYVGDEPTYADAGYVGTISTGAPTDAQYVVMTLNGTLTDERALAVTTPLALADGGANGNATLSMSGLSGWGSPGQAIRVAAGGSSFEWYTPSTGPTGTDTRVAFFDGTTIGDDSGFTYNKTTDVATLAGGLVVSNSGGYVSIGTGVGSTGKLRLGGSGAVTQVTWNDGYTDCSILATDTSVGGGGESQAVFGDGANIDRGVLAGASSSSLAVGGNFILRAVSDAVRFIQQAGGDELFSSSFCLRTASVTVASSGDTTLTDDEAACVFIYLSGTVGHGPDVNFPNPGRDGAIWFVENACSGAVYLSVGSSDIPLGVGEKAIVTFTNNGGWQQWI